MEIIHCRNAIVSSCIVDDILVDDSSKYKCIYKDDYKIHQKQVNLMMSGEIEDIRRMYPGWEIAELPEVAYTVDKETGEAKLPTWGIFITLFLYKPEGLSDKASEWDKRHKYSEIWREKA